MPLGSHNLAYTGLLEVGVGLGIGKPLSGARKGDFKT